MIPKTTKKSKKKFKSSELECVYDLMYDIKVSYPGEPIPRGPRHSMIYKIWSNQKKKKKIYKI